MQMLSPDRAQAIDYLLRAADAPTIADIAGITRGFRENPVLELPLQPVDESSRSDLELARAFCRAWVDVGAEPMGPGEKWREAARTLADALYAGRELTSEERESIARLAKPGERKLPRRHFWQRWFGTSAT
jgi:hypothetical protein